MTIAQFLKRWPLFLVAMAGGGLLGLLLAYVQQPRYVANMTIAALGPGDNAIQTGLPTSGSGVLQALRGLSGSSSQFGDGDYRYFIALLGSDRTAARLLKDPVFTHLVFDKEWDPQTRTWRRPDSALAPLAEWYGQAFFGRGYRAPDVPRLKERLNKLIAVQFDIENDQHIISAKGLTCARARLLVDTVFRTADSVVKAEKARRFSENVVSLRAQISDPRNDPLRTELASALVAQYLRQISVRSPMPLAARVIDGPQCAPRPVLPQPIPYAIAGAIFMLGLAIVWTLGRGILAARKESVED
jgi:hypothetical protein